MKIQPEHFQRLVEIESDIHYDQAPPAGQDPFTMVRHDSPVLLSAPHGARTWRNNKREKWHEEDEYTAGMALLLAELCSTSAIAVNWRSNCHDPNWHRDCAYKDAMAVLIQEKSIRYVIDLHGAALHSTCLSPEQTIDLGFRGNDPQDRSMAETHVQKLENLLRVKDGSCDPSCFVVGRNRLPAKGSRISEPITTFVHRLDGKHSVQAIQIEMKPQIRIAHRFPTATLYKSCGPYTADPNCVVHMLQALANFIDYLKAERGTDDLP